MTWATDVAADTPLIWWRFDEADDPTTAADASGNGTTGTYVNGAGTSPAGLVPSDNGRALVVDSGAHDAQAVRSAAIDHSFATHSLECIFHLQSGPSDGNYAQLVGFDDDGGTFTIEVYNNSGTLELQYFNFSGSASFSPVEVGRRYHVVGTYDGTDLRLYVDGTLVDTQGGGGADVLVASRLSAGCGSGSYENERLDGRIDEAVLYTGVLSGGRVTAHFAHLAPGSGPFALGAIDGAGEALDFELVTATEAVATLPGFQTQYRAVVVDMTGRPYADLATARVLKVTWNLNAPDEGDLEVSLDDPGLLLLRPTLSPPREVQIYRNGHLLLWGKATVRRADSATRKMTMTVKDPLWYLGKRYLGRANRRNFLKNGSFEGGAVNWATSGSLTFDTTTSNHLLGTRVAELQSLSSGNNYISQDVSIASGRIGVLVWLTAWVYVEQMTNPAALSLGIRLSRLADPSNAAFAAVDTHTPLKVWTRLSVAVQVPPYVPASHETLRAQLFAIQGTVRWDAVEMTIMESISYFEDTDQARIVEGVVGYLQGKGRWASLATDKTNLYIRTACPSTGIQKQRTWQLVEHTKGYDGGGGSGAIDEFLRADDGMDCDITYTPTSRTFRTYYPAIGTDRTDVTFTWRVDADEPSRRAAWACAGYTWGESLEGTSNQIIELGGWGNSNDGTREEGGYSNPSTLGGLTLELTESAPQAMPIGFLDSLARARGRQLERPVLTPQLILVEPRDAVTDEVTYPLVGVLLPGDTIAVDVADAAVQMSGNWRLGRVELDAVTDRLTVTPNPV